MTALTDYERECRDYRPLTITINARLSVHFNEAAAQEAWRQMCAVMSVAITRGDVDYPMIARDIERAMAGAKIELGYKEEP